MPAFEFTIISKACGRGEAINIVKRIAKGLWERNGLIRDIEFLGQLKLPTKMLAHDQFHWKGMYWLVKADVPLWTLPDLRNEWKRDVDLIRTYRETLKNEETIFPTVECRLEEESLPPAYREDVHRLMVHGKVPSKAEKL